MGGREPEVWLPRFNLTSAHTIYISSPYDCDNTLNDMWSMTILQEHRNTIKFGMRYRHQLSKNLCFVYILKNHLPLVVKNMLGSMWVTSEDISEAKGFPAVVAAKGKAVCPA